MEDNAELIIELGAKIKATRIELQRLEAALSSALRANVVPENGTSPVITEHEIVPSDVRRVFLTQPGRVFTANDLKNELGPIRNMAWLRTTISRLFKNGEIERVGEGRYRKKEESE